MKPSDCLPDPEPTQYILTLGEPVSPAAASRVSWTVLYHYSNDLTQTDLPKGSYLSSRNVASKQLARELTGAVFADGPIKRRAFWVDRQAVSEAWFKNIGPQAARMWADEYITQVEIPAGYFADSVLPDE
jgi:hypothetical protein